MTAEVSVVTEQLDDVVMVPTMALMTEDGEHYYVNVATDDEGKQTRRVKVPVVTQNDNENRSRQDTGQARRPGQRDQPQRAGYQAARW